MEKKQSAFKLIAFMAIGLFCIVIAIICFANNAYENSGYYEYTRYETYGGDAYTGIQNGTADTAKNVAEAGRTIRFKLCEILEEIDAIAGFAFIVAGLIMIVFAVDGFMVNKKISKNSVHSAGANLGNTQEQNLEL